MIGVADEIKQKLDVAEILGEYIKLTKAGRNFKAVCPFHAEKTPSLMVSQERQIWHCFGCGAGGDIFKFVMQMEGLEFGDALRLLARKAGVVLKKQDPEVQSQKKRLFEICELSAKFFEIQLEKNLLGQKAQKYLLDRGLKKESIKEWRLGFAPDSWQSLYDFLISRGYKDGEILQTGMIVKKDGTANDYYDRFRSRIMFPIADSQGQVIGFGGRVFGQGEKEKDMAKYVNSPQTSLYDKSRVLFGLNRAKTEIRLKDECLVVEGYMDLIMSFEAGVKNAVASSGTALTEEQLRILGRYTKNLLFAFDSDAAGENATKRGVDLALKQDFRIKVIPMKDKDPADVVKKDPAAWRALAENSQGVMDFYFDRVFEKHNPGTLDGQREIKKFLLPAIKSTSSRTEQSHWLARLAMKLRVSENDLRSDMQKIKSETDFKPNANAPSSEIRNIPSPSSRLSGIEERFLGLCLSRPECFSLELGLKKNDFENEKLAEIFSQFESLAVEQKKDLIDHLRRALSPELKIQVDYLSLKIEQTLPEDEKEISQEIQTCVRELKVLRLKNRLTALNFEIKEAQSGAKAEKMAGLLKDFSRISQELSTLFNNQNN